MGSGILLGDENMDWKEMLRADVQHDGNEEKILTATCVAYEYGRKGYVEERTEERERICLDLRYLFKDIQSEYLYYDPSETIEELGMTKVFVSQS